MSLKKNLLEKTNELIIQAITNGVNPWRKSWSDIVLNGKEINGPVNLISGNQYKGFNRFLLSCHPSDSPVFLTFKQVKSLGGMVKKGSASLPILYYSKVEPKEPVTDEEEKQKFFIKYYNVFNISDTTLNLEDFTDEAATFENQPMENIEDLFTKYTTAEKIKTFRNANSNFYNPGKDEIHLVQLNRFESSEEYYTTLLHEVIHSTGHPSRLDRLQKKFLSHKEYAFEELIAETAACYVASHLGINLNSIIDNSASYIDSWLKALESNQWFFLQAAKKAEQASDFLLSNYNS